MVLGMDDDLPSAMTAFLRTVVCAILGELTDPDEVVVGVHRERDGGYSFGISVPDRVRGLVMGPRGRWARSLESIAKARARALGSRVSVNVRVTKAQK